MTRHPELNEGSGSLVRSRVVNEAALANAARELDLGAVMRVGRGVKKSWAPSVPPCWPTRSRRSWRPSYFERGYEVAKEFVHHTLARDVTQAALEPSDVDPKTRLRQWAEARGLGTPHYEVVGDGPAHSTTYVATVRVGDLVAVGEGRSKKSAEGQAARSAWREHDRA